MRSFLRGYLIVTGVGAFVAISVPTLVVIGLFLGILPGLILGIMPTAFLWGLLFALGYWLVAEVMPRPAAGGVAAVAAVAVLLLMPQSGLKAARARLAATHEPERIPAQPIPVRGHVRIEVPHWDSNDPGSADRRPGPGCDGLCASLLFKPGVRSVTVALTGPGPVGKAGASRLRTFRLEPKGQRGADPLMPNAGRALTRDYNAGRLLEAEWRLRLSTEVCIAVVDDRPPAPDLIIRQRSTSAAHARPFAWNDDGVESRTTEILDRQGALLLRRRGAWARAIAAPLTVSGSGGLESFRMEWWRTVMKDGELDVAGNLAGLLLRHTDAAVTPDPAATVAAVRKRLAEVLADPAVPAGDPILNSAGVYLDALAKAGAKPDDEALVLAFIADPRVTEPNGIWSVEKTRGIDRKQLRAALVDRLARPDQPNRVVELFNSLLRKLPPRTFAAPTAAEARALDDPAGRIQLPALVERMADRGPVAVDPLLRIIRHHGEALQWCSDETGPKGGRRDLQRLREAHAAVIDAAIDGLRRLGPAAHGALPELERMRAEGLFRRSGWNWAETLAYLGKPIEQIERDSSIGNNDASFRASLRRKVARWDPDKLKD